MNAVATPPVKPDTPLAPAPAAVHRDGRTHADAPQATSRFMAAMQAVNRGQAPARSSADDAEVPQTIAGEEQSRPRPSADGPLDTAVADVPALAPVESHAIVLPADGMQAATDPAITGRLAEGAAEEPAPTAAAASADEPSTTGPFVGALRGAVHARPGSEMPATPPYADEPSARSAAHQAPIDTGPKPHTGVGTDALSSARTMTTSTEGRSPETADAIRNPGAPMPEMAGRPVQRSIAQVTAEANPNPSPSGAGQTGPLLKGDEGLPHPLQATDRQTASPVTRLFDATARQANLTTSVTATNTEMGPGSVAGKAAAETPEVVPSARLTVESAGTRDGSALNGDGKPSEDHHRPWLAAEQISEAKSGERPLRLDVDSRSDGMTAVDRTGSPPVGKTPQPSMLAKAPAPTAESFRSQNFGPIVERIAVSVRGEQSEARIALKPDHLGHIRLQIATENNTVSIRIMTEFPMARDLLESHLPQLKADLQQQGLDLDEFNITLDDEDQHFRREERRQPGTFRAPRGAARRTALSEAPSDDFTEDCPADRQSSATGVDFFA